jgi:hypothetical protein
MKVVMAVHKVAVSMPPKLIQAARADATYRGETLSGWLADAAERKLRRRRARQVLNEYEARHGEITKAELRTVRRRWPA